jgi:chemotaxis protein methyltransferase CheR
MTISLLKNQVTDQQLAAYADLIYKTAGIRISPQKTSLLSNRLRTRLRATGIGSYDEYLAFLKKSPANHPEWDAFLEEITTHETYLFRDQAQWDWFRDTYLPEVELEARRGNRRKQIRIWSAACSTGDEACTIACCLLARFVDPSSWKIEIVGSDIGIGAVAKARKQTFSQRSMRNVPDPLRRRFFTKGKESDTWQVTPAISSLLEFRQHNLLDKPPVKDFDVIFLKNVLIYFDRESKIRVIEQITDALKPSGFLVTGLSEGVGGLLGRMERKQGWLHQKR